MYHVLVRVTLRRSILDPQGQAVRRALHALGLPAVEDVRTGKFIELVLDTDSAEEAQAMAERACTALLANPVTEDYEVVALVPGSGRGHEAGVAEAGIPGDPDAGDPGAGAPVQTA